MNELNALDELKNIETNISLKANWNAPKNVKTLITTRIFNIATMQHVVEPYGNFNLALHVDDNPQDVIKNREYLRKSLPSNPYWLNQTHGNHIINLNSIEDSSHANNATDNTAQNHVLNYDASYTTNSNTVCAVMTADCLPILLTNTAGTVVAAIHAGWRGVLNGIITTAIKQILTQENLSPEDILIHIAPSICKQHFIAGGDVYDSFIALDPINHKFFDQINNADHIQSNKPTYHCDLIGIAQLQLLNLGILTQNISLNDVCTYCEDKLFYSYRRNNITGRFASCIWLQKN
jgi:YfiH family protein